MMRPLILLTNDDGIRSPGLKAAAETLDGLGELLVVAPYEQQSGAGRSMPFSVDGHFFEVPLIVNGRELQGYALQTSPALAVQHGVLELADRRPALVVSGINYGENVGTDVTVSGTVGAAIEAAAFGIPALAVSLQTDIGHHLTYEHSVDFSAAAHFVGLFAERLLAWQNPPDVDLLKVDVPRDAIPSTPWRVTRLYHGRHFEPVEPNRSDPHDKSGRLTYRFVTHTDAPDGQTDVGALLEGYVSVTPLSLDMTSRVDLETVQDLLGGTS